MKAREYLYLVKWLDMKGDQELQQFVLTTQFTEEDYRVHHIMLSGKWNPETWDPEVNPAYPEYEYLLDYYVIKDQWDMMFGNAFSWSRLQIEVGPEYQAPNAHIPDEMLHRVAAGLFLSDYERKEQEKQQKSFWARFMETLNI